LRPRIIGEYTLDSIQIYFNASLEIQDELIKHGFRVPLETPLPIIYGNFGGYEDNRTSRLAVKAAILNPERYGRTLSEMGWEELEGKMRISREYTKLQIEAESREGVNLITLYPKFEKGKAGYHLEKASYRGVSQTYWKNWAGFYMGFNELHRLANDLELKLGSSQQPVFWTHEKLPKGGGHEDTYFVSFQRGDMGIEPHSYSLCMGCWDNVIDYLKLEAERCSKSGIGRPDLDVKLRLEKKPDVPIRMKIGLAKMEEKRPQFMIKFSTFPTATMSIQGIDRAGRRIPIEGKPRGRLVKCDHEEYVNMVSIEQKKFLRAVFASNNVIKGIEDMNKLRRPDWLKPD